MLNKLFTLDEIKKLAKERLAIAAFRENLIKKVKIEDEN